MAFDFSQRNMTKQLPATVAAQNIIRVSESVEFTDFANRNITKVLSTIIGA